MDLSAYAAQRKQDEGREDIAPGMPIPQQVEPAAAEPETSPLASYVQQTRNDAAVRAEAVRQAYDKYGLDDAAAAEHLAALAKDKGIDLAPDAFLGQEGLTKSLALHEAREDMRRAPRLAGWAAEGGVNAIIADADKRNLSILSDAAAGAGYSAEMITRGALPRMEVSAAAKQIATLRRALGDKNRSYLDILIDEAYSALPSNQNAPAGLDQITGLLDLLAAPVDAAGRYARSRLFDETEEDLRPLEERGAYFAHQLSRIEAEVREGWGSGRLAQRVAPKLDAIGEIEGAGAQLSAIADLMYEDPAGMFAFTMRVLGESAPGLLATVGGAVAGGAGGAAVATGLGSYATSQIREFEEIAKEMGYDLADPTAAARLMQDPDALSKVTDSAHMYALVVAAFDGASGGVAGKQLSRSVVGNLVLQTAVQMAAGGGGEALGRALSDRKVNMVEVVMEMLAELPGGVVEVGAARGGIAVNTGRVSRAKRLQTQADQEFFEAIATVAKDSEARAKVPAKYREAVEAITADGHGETLFVDAGRLDQLFQSGEIDPDLFAEATGITAEQVAAEAARGGDVQIATADFAAKIVGSDIDAPLRQHMRVDPSRMSAAEAKEIEADAEQLRTEAEAIAEQAQAGETEFAAEIDTARAEFETALIERGGRTADVAAVEAAQLAAVYQTLAARTGLSPAAMLRRFPMPDVQRATSATTVQPTRLEQGSDAFNQWFGNSVLRDEAGQPLVMYHGTASDFEAHRGMVWGTPDPRLADAYAADRERLGRRPAPSGPYTQPLYMRLEAPFDARRIPGSPTPAEFVAAIAEQAAERGQPMAPETVADLEQRLTDGRRFKGHATVPATEFWVLNERDSSYFTPEGVAALRDAYAAGGFDGVTVEEAGAVTHGVFDPAQAKSIWNRGAYAMDDPRILNQSSARLPGLEPSSPGRVPGVRETATEYMRSHGMPIRHQAEYVKVDVARAKEIARLYDEMPATPAPEDEAETYAAYEALARETIEQYRAVEKLGFTFEWITGDDPYASPREAIRDMQENGHLWVFPTTEGFGTLNEAEASHPLLQPTGIIIDGRDALVNDLFRIVHDVFGHGSEGAAFGPRGEENAWQAHVRMFSPLAARAMTAETRGQNSWVNYGPHGAHNRANPQDTIFADQKVGLLPHWVSEVGQAQDVPLDRAGEPITLRIEDFSEGVTPELLTQPGWFVVTGMREDWGPHTDPRNATANAALRRALDAHGLRYTAVEGMYKGEPQGESYLVIGNEDIGLNLGREFGQESILTNRGLEYSDGRPDTPHVPAETVTGDAAKAQDFYSVMPDGTAWSMGLDWGAPAEPLFQSAPPVESEAFKAWFGDSKVVDESGAPAVVYHGTQSDFEAFARGRPIWVSRGTELPSAYALGRGTDAAVMPLYARAETPFDADLLPNDVSVAGFFDALEQQRPLSEAARAQAEALRQTIRSKVPPAPFLTFQRTAFWLDPERLFGADGAKAIQDLLRLHGFDSISMTEQGEQTYGLLDPEQVKSVFNRGTFDPNDARVLYQSAPAPIYRSALADAVQGAKQDRAKGKDWQAILPKLPGVKQAELVWTGTVDWLAERRDETVTKGELLAHLAENAVPLEEVVAKDRTARWGQYTEQAAGRDAGSNYREFLLTVPALELVGPNRAGGARPFVYDTHYSTPNIVVTARTTDRSANTLFVEEVQSDLASDHRKAGTSWRTAPDRASAQAALAEAEAARTAAVRVFAAAYDEASGGAYTDEQVLDLAEFAAAAGTHTRTGARAPRPDAQIMDMMADVGGVDPAVIARLHEAELARFRAREAVEGGSRAPYTPFEGGAEYELMAKRLLQRAVREGYDRLAWTPAYMQARRWNQAAQSVVERVMWAEAEGGGRNVDVVMHGGNPQAVTTDAEGRITTGPSDWVGNPLSSVLGSAAARVMAEPSGDIDNANITFPSSGYTVAYERHFKGAIEKLTKKLGGRVRVVDDVLPAGEVSMAALEQRIGDMQDAMRRGGTIEAGVEAALGGVPDAGIEARVRDLLTEEVYDEARDITAAYDAGLDSRRYDVVRLEQYVEAEEDPDIRARFQRRLDAAREILADAEANAADWAQDLARGDLTRAVREASTHLRQSAVWQPVMDHMRASQTADAVFAIEITDQMREALAEPFALFQGQRGSIVLPPSPGARPVISLFNGSDLSTVLHESGHYYLHIIEQLASGADAPEQLRADWATLRDWWRTNAEVIAAEVGTDPEAVHRYLDGQPLDRDTHAKVWRGLHEHFARGLEAYMLEGKAPSVRMRSIMASFAAWLKTIYARVRGELGVQIDDEVRAVFDRLYATDEEIAAYAAGDGALNRELAARLGAGERELDALARLAVEQQAEAQAYMLGIAGGAFRRQRRHDYRRRRSEIAAEVAAGLDEKPVYRALAWLSEARWIGEGEVPEGLPAVKLAETELTAAAYDDETIRALTARGLVAAEGLAPDDFADFFGFPSGDAMVQALVAAPRREAAARQQVRERLRREFGDSTFEARKAAPDAMNGDKRGQQLDAELRVLTGLLPGGGRATTRRQAATIAAQTIRNMPVRRAMRSEDFLAAERRAGRRVQQALVRRDVAAAAKAKREQLFQHTLYVESRKVAELVGKAERKAKQLQRAGTRKNLAGEYLGAIDEVLETYDFRRISGKAERERGRLRAYLDMMAEQGRMGEVVIPQEVIDEAKRVPYKSLTVDRLRGVYDSLRNIEHTAREAHKLRTAAAARDIREAVAEIVAEMDENLKDEPMARAKSQRSYAKSVVDWYANIALNADTRLRQYGGWKMGAAYRHLKTEIDAAGVREAQMRHEAAVTLDGFVKRYDVKERLAMGKKRHYAELGGEAFTKWDLLSMALNMGNEENLNRLRGEGTPRPMSEAQIEFVKSQLDARDWKFVQDVWDYLDSFWPQIAERERRITGVAPQRVEPLPVETPYGTLRGGYYPIKYDGELSGVVEAEQLQEQLAAMQAGRFGKAQTKNGHTKARVGSGGRVLAVDINVLFVHVNDVIHDLAFQEATANTWRLLRQPELVEAFRRKGRAADLEMLEIWVQDVAVGGGVGGGVLGKIALTMKNNFTVSRLALNAATVLLQATGVTHSIAMIGPKYMGIGLADYLPHVRSRAVSVVAQSEFMANRARFVNPDYMEFVNEGQRAKAVSVMDAGLRKFAQYGLAPMQMLQFFGVDMPTWLGAHARALSEGLEGAEAVHYADRMVARAQGGTAWADRTAFERGSLARDQRFNGFMRLWSTLASYMMAKGNIAFEVAGRARKENTVAGYMAAATHLVLLFAFEEIVRGVLKGEIDWGDDDEKKDGPLLYALKGGALSVMGVSPFIRDLGSALDGFDPGMYSSFFGTMAGAFTQVKQGEMDEALRRSLINAVGLMAPVPSGQVNRIIDAATDEEGAEIIHYLMGKPK